MTDKIIAEDFIKAFGSGGVKEPEHHIITDNIMEDYESPITLALQEIANKITEERENRIIVEISEQMGVKVDKHELARALAYDRDQYRNGFEAAWLAREKDVMTWIPIKMRDLTEEEQKKLEEEYDGTEGIKAFDCPMPDDGQKILISSCWGIFIDVCIYDSEFGYGLEDHDDWDGVDAWMPLPEPYKKPEQLGGES